MSVIEFPLNASTEKVGEKNKRTLTTTTTTTISKHFHFRGVSHLVFTLGPSHVLQVAFVSQRVLVIGKAIQVQT